MTADATFDASHRHSPLEGFAFPRGLREVPFLAQIDVRLTATDQVALDAVMSAFLSHTDGTLDGLVPNESASPAAARERLLSQAISAAECEEEMADPDARRGPQPEASRPAVARLLSRIRRAVPRRSGT